MSAAENILMLPFAKFNFRNSFAILLQLLVSAVSLCLSMFSTLLCDLKKDLYVLINRALIRSSCWYSRLG